MGIPVKLEAFEGPLDLLLHLIEKIKLIFMIFRSWKLRTSIWITFGTWKQKI